MELSQLRLPELRLPTFLQPLRLIPHYQGRIAESVSTWLRPGSDRLVGPIEQTVAAAVIIGLAMQTPSSTWQSRPLAERYPSSSSIPGSSLSRQDETNRLGSSPGFPTSRANTTIAFLHSLLPTARQISPATLALIVMSLNLLVMLVPADLMRRLKESRRVFWPPWQDRPGNNDPNLSSQRQPDGPGRRAHISQSEKARESKHDQAARTDERQIPRNASLPSSNSHAAADQREKAARSIEKEKARSREAVMTADPGDNGAKASKGDENRSKAQAMAMEKAKRTALLEKESAKLENGSRSSDVFDKSKELGPNKSDEETTERARLEKENAKSRALRSSKAGESDGFDPEEERAKRALIEREKAKRRTMEERKNGHNKKVDQDEGAGERARRDREAPQEYTQGQKASSDRVSQSERSRRARANDGASPRENGSTWAENKRSEEESTSKVTTEHFSPDEAKTGAANRASQSGTSSRKPPEPLRTETRPSSSAEPPSPSGSGNETDDPLMAGDYRPLRSALKKSKKKPRQNKNIHHNYSMTMRGWRPSLVPFPHGLHPKPDKPRHNLWWDNIPKDVDHVTAPPPVPKMPESGPDDEEKDGEKEKEGKKKDHKDGAGKSGASTSDKANTRESKPLGAPKEEKGDSKDKKKALLGDEERAKHKGAEHPDDADKLQAPEREKAKVKEQEKFKEAEKMKEAKRLKEWEKEKSKLAAAAEAKAPREEAGSGARPVPPAAVPINPQLLKAQYASQGLLCVLLYLVSEQLGLLLLAFFAYQHVRIKQTAAVSASTAPESSITSSAKPTTRNQESDASERMPSEMKAKYEEAMAKKREKEKGKTELEASRDKKADGAEMTPEMREKYEQAKATRKGKEKAAGLEAFQSAEEQRGSAKGPKDQTMPTQLGKHDEAAQLARRKRAERKSNSEGSHPPKQGTPDNQSRSPQMTPEMREKYERAKAAKKEQKTGSEAIGQSGKDRRARFEDDDGDTAERTKELTAAAVSSPSPKGKEKMTAEMLAAYDEAKRRKAGRDTKNGPVRPPQQLRDDAKKEMSPELRKEYERHRARKILERDSEGQGRVKESRVSSSERHEQDERLGAERADKREKDPPDDRAEKSGDTRRTLLEARSGRPDMTLEERQTYERARRREEDGRRRQTGAGPDRGDRDSSRRIRLGDMTPEMVEELQKARTKRRVAKERDAKMRMGQGSSGMSPQEKEELASPLE